MKIASATVSAVFFLIIGTANAQLVGHWVADDWSGTGSWVDRVSKIPATIQDNPKRSTTLFATPGAVFGISFDGNDAFNVTATNSPVTGAAKFTVLAMFRTNTPGVSNQVGTNWWSTTGIVGAEVGGNHNDWGLKVLLDRRAQGGFMGDSHASGNIVDGRIHTSALTWDGATGACKFYLDGELQGGFTQGLGTIANNGFAIAQFKENGNSAFFTGDIAIVQLYRSIEDIGKLHLALTGCIASAPNYGVGLAGRLGIPTLTPSAAPVFLRNINVLASNSSGTAALGLILVGQQAVSIPLLGGRLLVNPIAQAGTLVPVGGLSIPFAVPDLSALCRTPSALSYRVQVLQLDNAAVGGVAMSPGLRLFLGH
jgi:hypothetical protein